MTFRYLLNAHQCPPTRKNPFLHYGCKPVVGWLIETRKLVRCAVTLTAPILFQCQAGSIAEADQKFITRTQINPAKRPDIGCTVSAP